MMVRSVDGLRTIAGKEGYIAKNAPMAHSGPGVRRLAHRRVHSCSEAPLERGWKGMGLLAASTQAHERRGHPGPRSSLGWFPVHGFSSNKGNEPLGPAGRTQELYGLATKSLESVTN